MEFACEPGVPGELAGPCLAAGSEFWRRRCDKEKISPKLFLPAVEVDVLPDGGGIDPSSIDLASEPIVDERPLAPKRGGANVIDGVDVPDLCDPATEPFLIMAGPGAPNGAFVNAMVDCVGEVWGDELSIAPLWKRTDENGRRLGDIDFLGPPASVGVRERLLRPEAGGGIRTGKGNSGPLSFFFRLGSRKKVVVVDIVCVVVVWAYTEWSPALASDLDDSESLEMGMARDEVDSSP